MSQPYDYFKSKQEALEDLEEHLNDTADVISEVCGDKDDAVVRAISAQIKRCIRAVQDLRYEFTIYADLVLFMQGFIGDDTNEGTTEGHEIEHQGDA